MAVRADDVDLVRDRDLVLRFQAGEDGAFSDLYQRYFDRLFRFCLKRVGDPHEAEEVAQETFVRALRAVSGLDGERRFYPWLTVIASRLCVDSHRRRARVEASDCVELGAVEGGQEERLIADDDRRVMGLALARLGPRHREVLALREEQGWSYQRIADHYEVSIGTVEALLFRARRALKREYQAVTGSEGRWVALPVVGWMARRMHDLRLRMGELAAQAIPPLAGNAAAAAMVVSSAAVAVGFVGAHSPAPVTAQVRTMAVAGFGGPGQTLEADAPSSRPVSELKAVPPPPTDASPEGRKPAIAGPRIADAGTGARHTEDAPVGGDAGPVSAGLDPDEAAGELGSQTEDTRDGVQAWQEESKAFADKAVGENS